MDMIANLANKITDFKEAAQALFESDMLGTGAAKTVNITRLATSGCSAETSPNTHAQSHVTRIRRKSKDWRRRFCTRAHPDVMLTDFREPEKRFLDRISRDTLVHDVIPVCQLGNIRLRRESIIQKMSLARPRKYSAHRQAE